MKYISHLLVLVLLLGAMLVFEAPPTTQSQAPAMSGGCTLLNSPDYDGTYSSWSVLEAFYAGEIITITVVRPADYTSTDLARMNVGSALVDTATISDVPADLTYEFPANIGSVTVNWRRADGWLAVWSVSCQASANPPVEPPTEEPPTEEPPVDGTPVEGPAIVVAGCDVGVVPAGSVVGQVNRSFVADWAPGKPTTQPITIEAGKTAWVIGLDESAEYYKFAWSCQYLWAPADAFSPNPDAVWQSMALPTRVVK